MRFGYLWKGPNVPTVREQRAMLSRAEKIIEEKPGTRVERDLLCGIVREGDQVCVATSLCAGDDIVDLHHVLAALRDVGASLWVADFGRDFQGSMAMAEITEDFIDQRRQQQTQKAREKLRKLPKSKRGGRPVKALPEHRRDEFVDLWSIKDNSKRFVARRFETTPRVVDRWAEQLDLPAK